MAFLVAIIALATLGLSFGFRSPIIGRRLFKSHILLANLEDDEVICAKRGSMGVDVVKDEIYYWCSCGNSGTQPFCDGAHQLCYQSLSTGIGPYEYIAPETKTVYFCGCKQSGSIPLCDGSHGKLPKDAEGKSLKKNT